jgi:O-antigen/teichoic acid export membrane protein
LCAGGKHIATTATEPRPIRIGARRVSAAFGQLYALIQPGGTSERALFVQRVAGTFVVRVVLVAIGFLTSIATARLLGPSGRGIYGTAVVLVTLASQFGNLGMHVSNTYFVSGRRSLLPILISNSLLVSLVGGGGISLLVLLLFKLCPAWAPVQGAVLDLALWLIPVTLGVLLLQNLLLGIQEVKWYNVTDITGKGLFLLSCGTFTIALHHWDPEYVMVVALASALATFLMAGARLMAITGRLPRPDFDLIRLQAGYGLKSYVICLAGYVVLKSDVLIVKQMAGAAAAGYYSLASSMTDYVYMFPTVVGMMLFPALSATASPLQRWNRAKKTMLGIIGIMSLLSLCAAIIARPVIALVYGRDFLPALPAFLVLCLAIVFYGANTVISIYFSSSGLPWFSVGIWPAAAALNIGLNLYAIRKWGIVGAAISSLLTYSALFLAQYSHARRTVGREQYA